MTDKKRILLVDDEEKLLEVLSRALMRYDYEVMTAQGVSEAIESLKKKHIDLIITDLVMPEITGMELLKRIKTAYLETGVIILTGYGGIKSYHESMNVGAFEYLNKPIKIQELLTAVENFFSI